MSDRRKKLDAKNKMYAYVGAGIVHAIIIGALIFNFASDPKPLNTADGDKIDEVVQATTVDESVIKKQRDKLRKAERARELEKQREQKRLKDLKKKSEDKRKEVAELERQREAIALKKKKDEEQAKKDEELRKKRAAERLAKEQKEQKEREEKRIKEEAEALERQRELNESLAAEERLMAERLAKQRTTTLIAKYGALVERRVDSFRTISPDFESWRVTEINIKLSPLGVVQQTRIVKSSGSALYDKSVEDAILKASPLPIPDVTLEPDANAQFQNINYKFRMPGA